MKASFIEDEFMRAPVLRLLLRSTQALLTQMTQTACAIDTIHWTSSFWRWLLLSLDRLEGADLVMTEELIATCSACAGKASPRARLNLQRAGHIRYSRGHILVLDRPGLQKRTCEFYVVVTTEYDGLLPDETAS